MTRHLALALFALAAAARAQTPQLAPHGDHAGDNFGAALCTTDDLDGDGVPDLLVGAPADPGSASAPGYARLFSGKTGALLMRFVTHGGADAFGAAVAASGDVDGDGRRDLLVGNPGAAGPRALTEVRVFSSVDGHLITLLPGGARLDSWDAFGHALADLGDLDGDGTSDFAVGAPSLSLEQPGYVRIFAGRTATLLHHLDGDAAGDEFGFAIAGAGDVNHDGTPDLLISAPGGNSVRVVSGADASTLLEVPGSGGQFGGALLAPGDMDGDGTPDLAIASPLFNRVDIDSGKDGHLLRRFEKPTGQFGSAMAALGDVNADGVPDLLVGAPTDDVVTTLAAGAGYAVDGANGHTLFKFAGDVAGSRLGAAAAAADLDGDGRKECLLGAPVDAAPNGVVGTARLYSGKLPGSIVNYGQGCPGSFLITPRLDVFGDPLPGGALTLSVSKALGGAPALLAIGGGADVVPFPNGCILWMSPLVVGAGFVLDGGFPGAGTKLFTGHLPADTPVGLVFAVQVVISDSGADGFISTTSAYLVTVQ